jgi:GR25 family glycosyltransferase involved in LPS biosynthesis
MLLQPFYINLEKRVDRRQQFEEQCERLGLSPRRIVAEYTPEAGYIGCLKSHIKALESESDDQPLWICEDDCLFLVSKEELERITNEFLNSDADILCLAYGSRNHTVFSETFQRSYDLQTASCYIIKPKFRNVLLTFWKSILDSILGNYEHPRRKEYESLPVTKGFFNTTDQSWKLFQQSHVFVIPKTRCAIQRESYSDIEQRRVNYGV